MFVLYREEQKTMEQRLNDLQSKVIVGGVNLVRCSACMVQAVFGKSSQHFKLIYSNITVNRVNHLLKPKLSDQISK